MKAKKPTIPSDMDWLKGNWEKRRAEFARKLAQGKQFVTTEWEDAAANGFTSLIKAARKTPRNDDDKNKAEESARNLLLAFIERTEEAMRDRAEYGTTHATAMDTELCVYLAGCFKQTLRDISKASIALNLSKRIPGKRGDRGPKPSSATDRNHMRRGYEVATEYRRLKKLPARRIFRISDLLAYDARMDEAGSNKKMGTAARIVAKRHRKTLNTILAAYNSFRQRTKAASSPS